LGRPPGAHLGNYLQARKGFPGVPAKNPGPRQKPANPGARVGEKFLKFKFNPPGAEIRKFFTPGGPQKTNPPNSHFWGTKKTRGVKNRGDLSK